MRGGGRPCEVGGGVDHAGTDGVEVDVGEGGEEVMRVEDAGVKAILPEPAAAHQASMEVLGVLRGQVLHEAADAVFDLACNYEVDVIGHEGIAVDGDLAKVSMVVEEGEEVGAVGVSKEDGLPVVPRWVMWSG